MAPAVESISRLLSTVPSGAWVAITRDATRVIGFSSELRDVIEKSREEGEEDPIITRVPEVNTSLILNVA